MPSYLWSDPTPSDATSATIASRSEVSAPNISGVVSAILEDRYRKEQQKQQLTDSILKSIGGIAHDYKSNADSNGVADYIQSHSPYVNSADAAQLSGLSGDARLTALGWAQKQNDEADKQAQEYIPGDSPDTYTDAHGIHYVRGRYGWQAVAQSATGQPSANQALVQDRFNEGQAQKDLNQKIKDLNIVGGMKDEITRSQLTNPDYAHSGVGPGNEYVPDGYYALGTPRPGVQGKDNLGLQTVVPAGQFDAARQAADTYQKMLDSHAAGGVPQSATNPGPPVGTKATIQGRPATWDGHGWLAD